VLTQIQHEQPQTDVLATIIPGNDRSVSLLKKLGFCFEGELEQNGELLNLYKATADQIEISNVVDSFFQVFVNKNGRTPDWDLLSRLCIPEVLFIAKGATYQAYNFNAFVEPRQKILTDGTLTDFEEHEIAGETEIKRTIAQRSTTYSKSGKLNGKYFEQTGCKLFQFLKAEQGWRVSSAIWEDDPIL
jgi:hypothetical protein